MGSKAKYQPGPEVRDPMIAVSLILQEKTLFLGRKPMGHGWLENMSLANIRMACRCGRLRMALDKRDLEPLPGEIGIPKRASRSMRQRPPWMMRKNNDGTVGTGYNDLQLAPGVEIGADPEGFTAVGDAVYVAPDEPPEPEVD